MKSLQQRTAAAGLTQHAGIPPRVYDEDSVQLERIKRARVMAFSMLKDVAIAACPTRIIELGCGTGDISGPFVSENTTVEGFDCNPASLKVAVERFPGFIGFEQIPDEPLDCDILVLCEFLEHLENPLDLVSRWLPRAHTCLISHPLDGDLNGDLSAGEHQWSFSLADFFEWFPLGKHKLVAHEVFKMGGYQIVMGRGEHL